LKLKPDFAQAHSYAGILLANMGRFDEALSHLQSALEENANDAGAHYNLALLLEKMGKNEEAAIHRQKALELERRP
jgi:tetratricopeptide (TPR) repeat protein